MIRRDDHDHGRHAIAEARTIAIEAAILAKNDRIAQRNRGWLRERKILLVNLIGAPGAGKTSLLERTSLDVGDELAVHVVEGDQETERDAARIRATGRPVVQLNTGRGCHLDASMIASALSRLSPPEGSVVLVENVGNLVCPALFDLGELAKVVIVSVTEGEDKPLKYPHVFRASQIMLLSKTDLLPHLAIDVAEMLAHARRVSPRLEAMHVSALRGEGLAPWYTWLRGARASCSLLEASDVGR